jgi:putative ABC transport system permease protein
MRRVVLSELRHRRGRAFALLLGILVATTSFTVLTATSRTQRLDVRGTVARSFRGDYDILVRPRGSRSAYERRTGQVQPNFLSGLFGGITTGQWRRIERTPGVEVAASVANLGYLLPTAKVPVDATAAAGPRGQLLLRARVAWRADAGLTRVQDAPQFTYVTSNRLRDEPYQTTRNPDEQRGIFFNGALREDVPGRSRPVSVCNSVGFANDAQATLDGPFKRLYRSQYGCYSRRGLGRWRYAPLRRSRPRVVLRFAFPLLLSAVDPDAEARLTGLDRAVVDGRYLRDGDAAFVRRTAPFDARLRFLPVLAASRTYVDEQAEVAIERLDDATLARWLRPFPMSDGGDYFAPLRHLLRSPHGPVVERVRVDAATAYRRLLRQLRGSDWDVSETTSIWRTGATQAAGDGAVLRPRTEPVDDNVWQNSTEGGPLTFAFAPPTARDTRFRELTRTAAYIDALTRTRDSTPLLRAVGTFDPDALGTAPEPGAAPLSSLQPPVLYARDAAAAARLRGRSLRPSGNLGGYLAQPPGLLTTMRAARTFGPPLFKDWDPDRAISAVRVRVAGVTGIDALSRERIRQAAERIATRTGLDVDITAGASGAPTAVDLAAGRYGRPALALTETWVRKGVAARVLSAVDRKSVMLFALILVVAGLFVANATSAAVRSRRTELGVLASLGWPTGRLFAVVLAEVGAIGVAAGVAGCLLALPLAALVGVNASLARAALAVPAAVVLALLAALTPALRAARAQPVAAVRPAVLEARRAWRPSGLGRLALVNLLRTPGRTALGALSLTIGVCALTLLLAATFAFHDVLVGTLLGDAVAVQVRGTDYVAVIATVGLGIAAVVDVLFLGVRERASELATLSATGWDDRSLGRLVALEGLWIGMLGATAGALLGLAGAALFAGKLPAELLVTSLAAAAAGALLAALAALLPAAWLRRLPAVELLAQE